MVVLSDRIPAKAYVYGMIFALSNRLQCVGDRRSSEVTTTQCFMIASLTLFDDYRLNLGEMARLLGTSRQNAKKTANLLMKKGYLDLRKDQADGRSVRMALTDKGREYYQGRAVREEEYLERLFEGFDSDLVEQMKKGFEALMRNIGNIEKQQLGKVD